MRRWLISGLLAGLLSPLSALAQPGLSTKPNYDAIYNADRTDENTLRTLEGFHDAVTGALSAGDFSAAEAAAALLLRRDPTTTDANFLMGLAKSGLGQWAEARRYLETAVGKEPQRPEPKARLGVAYAMLKDEAGAARQRAGLQALKEACGTDCRDAQWITQGLALIDQALAGPAGTTPFLPPAPNVSTAIAEVTGFDPQRYGLALIGGADELYEALTREGRCPAGRTAARREPCALILYRPQTDEPGGRTMNFRPVFRVDSPSSVWTTRDGRLQKVRISDLSADVTDTVTQKQVSLAPRALVGNAENRTSCETGRPCLNALGARDMFSMYQNMPETVVRTIWGREN